MTDLVAKGEPVEEPVDLLSWYVPDESFFLEKDGIGIVSQGVVETIRVPPGPDQTAEAARRTAAVLERVRTTGPVPPVAVGALPFDGNTPATLVVPRLAILRRPDGSTWRIEVESPRSQPASRAKSPSHPIRPSPIGLPPNPPQPSRPSQDPPSHRQAPENSSAARHAFGITPIPSPESFVDSVAAARKWILNGDLEKVVLARMLMLRADEPFDRRAILGLLREREPGAYVFAVHGFLGASPELLVSRFGNRVRAAAIAGTIRRPGEKNADAKAAELLLESEKDRAEHALVVVAARSGLEEVCKSISNDAGPRILPMRNVLHLVTEIDGVLRPPEPGVLDVAARLAPTPAVCGTPRDAAMRVIGELESIDRTLYAGLVGWQDASGDGEWAVALRCAEVQGRIALLFAGAGIVAGSDPEAELEETEAKFQTMLGVLGDSPRPMMER